MSPGHAVLPCRRLPDFVVAADATTRCRRERIPTAMESAIRARFVRDSFHSLITALSLSRKRGPAMWGGGSRALSAVRVAPVEVRLLFTHSRNRADLYSDAPWLRNAPLKQE